MASYICSRCAVQRSIAKDSFALSSRLKPSSTVPLRSFSTTSSSKYPREHNGKRFNGRDANKMRFVSAQRGTGLRPRQSLSVKLENLAVPVDDASRTPLAVDEDHGLWDFFNKEKRSIWTPTELADHGRAWSQIELQKKSWQDLHTLWWICVKERNRLYTDQLERERLKAGYGDSESQERDDSLRKTMKNIKFVLTNRYYDWQDARELVSEDPECEITEEGGIRYVPQSMSAYEEEPLEVGNIEAGHETGGDAKPSQDRTLLGSTGDGTTSDLPPPPAAETTPPLPARAR